MTVAKRGTPYDGPIAPRKAEVILHHLICLPTPNTRHYTHFLFRNPEQIEERRIVRTKMHQKTFIPMI